MTEGGRITFVDNQGRLGFFEIGTETVCLVSEYGRGFPSPVRER